MLKIKRGKTFIDVVAQKSAIESVSAKAMLSQSYIAMRDHQELGGLSGKSWETLPWKLIITIIATVNFYN